MTGPVVRLHPSSLDPMTMQVTLMASATDPVSGNVKQDMITWSDGGPYDPLGVTFPAGTRGLTTYQVTAYSDPSCPLATGSAELNLDSDDTFELSVTMTATPMCGNAATLTVQVASVQGGTGSIVSVPAGINCQGTGSGCSAVFPKGTAITLSAQPAANFAGWAGGSCMGIGSCAFTLSQDTGIQAVFSTCRGWCKEQLPAGVTANLNAIGGTASNNVLIAGDAGTAVLWNGSTWTTLPLPQNATSNLYAVAGKLNGSGLYAAGDSGTILALTGTTFTPIIDPTTTTLRAASAGHGNNPYFYFVGDGGIGVRLPPAATAAVNKISVGPSLYGIAQNPSGGVDQLLIGGAALSGAAYAQLWDGSSGLTPQMGPPGTNIAGDIHAVFCGVNAFFAAGAAGAIVSRSSGSNYSNNWVVKAAGVTTQTLRGLWASADSNVFAVGDAGTIMQYDGTSWALVQSNTTANLRAIWGTSPGNIYAVGDNGTLLHYLP